MHDGVQFPIHKYVLSMYFKLTQIAKLNAEIFSQLRCQKILNAGIKTLFPQVILEKENTCELTI